MNMHDGHAKCTQLMVSLFHNKGLMYIQDSYLLKLFLQICCSSQKCSSLAFPFELWVFHLHYLHGSDQAYISDTATDLSHQSAEG